MAVLSVRRNGVSHFYHSDGLGSTRQLIDANQNVTDEYVYDSWGNLIASSGTTENPLKYVGQEHYHTDDQSGVILLGVRYYEVSATRFLTQDPVRDSECWFSYALQSPVRNYDLTGLSVDNCITETGHTMLCIDNQCWDFAPIPGPGGNWSKCHWGGVTVYPKPKPTDPWWERAAKCVTFDTTPAQEKCVRDQLNAAFNNPPVFLLQGCCWTFNANILLNCIPSPPVITPPPSPKTAPPCSSIPPGQCAWCGTPPAWRCQ